MNPGIDLTLPKSARAAVFTGPRAPFRIEEFPLREPHPDEVLVRVTMATICRSDLHSYLGLRPTPCPGILGHEIVGRIAALGELVRKDLRGDPLRPGDRITWTEYFQSGHCYHRDVLDMPQKCPDVQKYGHESALQEPHLSGGFADYCYLRPGTGILRLPRDLPDEAACPINCGVATMAAVTEAAQVGLGSTVVIQGLGLLGLHGAAMAKARGARMVIGMDPLARRRELAEHFGVDAVFDPCTDAEPIEREITALCRPDGADAVIEVTGEPQVIVPGLRLLRTGGRYVLAGLVNPGSNVTIDAHAVLRRCLTITGVHNYHPRHLLQALDFVTANRERFPFHRLVDGNYPLDRIEVAFKDAAERRVLRAAVVP